MKSSKGFFRGSGEHFHISIVAPFETALEVKAPTVIRVAAVGPRQVGWVDGSGRSTPMIFYRGWENQPNVAGVHMPMKYGFLFFRWRSICNIIQPFYQELLSNCVFWTWYFWVVSFWDGDTLLIVPKIDVFLIMPTGPGLSCCNPMTIRWSFLSGCTWISSTSRWCRLVSFLGRHWNHGKFTFWIPPQKGLEDDFLFELGEFSVWSSFWIWWISFWIGWIWFSF